MKDNVPFLNLTSDAYTSPVINTSGMAVGWTNFDTLLYSESWPVNRIDAEEETDRQLWNLDAEFAASLGIWFEL